jgi:hypothetical protein
MKYDRIAIMQPTFLPWAGYFNLMHSVSGFIFLDDVQLDTRSWQTRNRIIVNKNAHWVSVPIRHANVSQKINQTVIINEVSWKNKLAKSFEQNYCKHPYYSSAKSVIDFLLAKDESILSNFNIDIINFIAKNIGIQTPTHLASEYSIEASRTSKLVYLCKCFSSNEYLSPVGSAEYLADDDFVGHSEAKLIFQNYVPDIYVQKNSKEFIASLSIIDVIANIGWDKTAEYIKGK